PQREPCAVSSPAPAWVLARCRSRLAPFTSATQTGQGTGPSGRSAARRAARSSVVTVRSLQELGEVLGQLQALGRCLVVDVLADAERVGLGLGGLLLGGSRLLRGLGRVARLARSLALG